MLNQEGIIKLEDFFRNRYQYEYTDKESLAQEPFIEYEGFGATAVCWISDGENRYLFKEIEEGSYTWLSEILSAEMAKILEIPCAEYKLVTLEGKLGILSKNFIKENETLLLGAQIVQEVLNKYPYLKAKNPFEDETFLENYNVPEFIPKLDLKNRVKYLHNNLNNLEQLWSILSIYCDIHHIEKEHVEPIMNQLKQTFFFDLLTFQADRHITNWGILRDENKIKPSLLFDSAGSFGLASKDLSKRIDTFNDKLNNYNRVGHDISKQEFINTLYKDRLLLTPAEDAITNPKNRKRQNNLEVLDYFLNVSTNEDIELLNSYITKLQAIGIKNILDSVLNKYHLTIDEKVHRFICQSCEWNYYFLTEKIHQKRR